MSSCFRHPIEEQEHKLTTYALFMPGSKDATTTGLSYANSFNGIKIVPAMETLKQIPWAKDEGFVMTRFYNKDHTPFFGCPRFQLERTIKELRNLGGYSVKAGFEIEFQLFKGDSDEPVEYLGYNNHRSMDRFSEDFKTIYKYLNALEIEVEAMHKESGNG